MYLGNSVIHIKIYHIKVLDYTISMVSERSYTIPPPQHTAVELPDGDIQYCKPVSINRNNPYLAQPLNGDNTQDYREVECNGEIITIHAATLTNALKLQCKAQVVRFLCLLDFVMNIFIAMSTYYGSLYSIIVAGISLVGYYSTFTF